MTAKQHILIVEDDEAIARGLELNLRLAGFRATIALDSESALESVAAEPPGLLLLDIGLPGKSGLELLDVLRKRGDLTPVIVLSARQNETDKVAALRLGADDYVTKPFGVAELLARIDAVLRRAGNEYAAGETDELVLAFGSVRIDLEARKVFRKAEEVALTRLEFELLVFLARHAGKVFSREELLGKVWGVRHKGSPRTVDNFVAQLRAKLEDDANQPRHLVTVRGSGYRFDT